MERDSTSAASEADITDSDEEVVETPVLRVGTPEWHRQLSTLENWLDRELDDRSEQASSEGSVVGDAREIHERCVDRDGGIEDTARDATADDRWTSSSTSTDEEYDVSIKQALYALRGSQSSISTIEHNHRKDWKRRRARIETSEDETPSETSQGMTSRQLELRDTEWTTRSDEAVPTKKIDGTNSSSVDEIDRALSERVTPRQDKAPRKVPEDDPGGMSNVADDRAPPRCEEDSKAKYREIGTQTDNDVTGYRKRKRRRRPRRRKSKYRRSTPGKNEKDEFSWSVKKPSETHKDSEKNRSSRKRKRRRKRRSAPREIEKDELSWSVKKHSETHNDSERSRSPKENRARKFVWRSRSQRTSENGISQGAKKPESGLIPRASLRGKETVEKVSTDSTKPRRKRRRKRRRRRESSGGRNDEAETKAREPATRARPSPPVREKTPNAKPIEKQRMPSNDGKARVTSETTVRGKRSKSRKASGRTPLFCTNCGETEHVTEDCRNPRSVLCTWCGRRDVMTPDCGCFRSRYAKEENHRMERRSSTEEDQPRIPR